ADHDIGRGIEEAALLDEAHGERALPLHKSRGAARSAPPLMSALSARRRLTSLRALKPGRCSSLSLWPPSSSRSPPCRLPPRRGRQLNFCARTLHDRPVGPQQENKAPPREG